MNEDTVVDSSDVKARNLNLISFALGCASFVCWLIALNLQSFETNGGNLGVIQVTSLQEAFTVSFLFFCAALILFIFQAFLRSRASSIIPKKKGAMATIAFGMNILNGIGLAVALFFLFEGFMFGVFTGSGF